MTISVAGNSQGLNFCRDWESRLIGNPGMSAFSVYLSGFMHLGPVLFSQPLSE